MSLTREDLETGRMRRLWSECANGPRPLTDEEQTEMRRHPEWQDIPVLVVTAKDLTAEERGRLNGDEARVLQKGAAELDELLREIGRVLPGSIERGRVKKAAEQAA